MIKKISLITLTDIFSKALTYLLLPLYLGIMPKEEYGEYTFYFSVVSPISITLSLSLFVSFIKNFCSANNFIKKRLIVSTIFNSIIIWLIILTFIVLIFTPIISHELGYIFGSTKFIKIKFLLLSGIIINAIFALFIYSLLIARNYTSEICFYIFLKFFVTAFLSLFILYSDFILVDTVLDRLLGFFIADTLLNIGFGFYLLRQYLMLRINKIIFFYNLKLALPLVPMSIISIAMILIDRKFILFYHGLSDLADYNLTFQILLPLQVIMSALQVVWAPHIFKIQDLNQAFKKTLRVAYLACFFMFLGVIGLWLLIKITLYLNLITDSYKNIPQLILFGSIGMMSLSLMHLFNNLFVHLNKTVPLLILSVFIAILFFIISFYLIPIYSSVGAFISMGIVQTTKVLLAAIILYIFCKKKYSI